MEKGEYVLSSKDRFLCRLACWHLILIFRTWYDQAPLLQKQKEERKKKEVSPSFLYETQERGHGKCIGNKAARNSRITCGPSYPSTYTSFIQWEESAQLLSALETLHQITQSKHANTRRCKADLELKLASKLLNWFLYQQYSRDFSINSTRRLTRTLCVRAPDLGKLPL